MAKLLYTDAGKMNQLKMAPVHQLSVIDILGDDEPNGSSNGSLGHEAHLAFSMRGLINVETEIPPIHSVDACSRTLLEVQSSPLEAPKHAHSFKDFGFQLTKLECELVIDVPFCSSVEHSFCTKHPDFLGNSGQKSLSSKEFSLFSGKICNQSDFVGNDDLDCKNKGRTQTFGMMSFAGCGILPGNTLYERNHGLSDKNWMDPVDASADFCNPFDIGKKALYFWRS